MFPLRKTLLVIPEAEINANQLFSYVHDIQIFKC